MTDYRLILDQQDKSNVAIVVQLPHLLATTQDALDLMAEARFSLDAEKLLIPISLVDPRFFDLSTGILGDILQKWSNYQLKAAFIGDFSLFTSNTLPDFIYESNRGSQFFFLPDEDQALQKLHSLK